MTEPTLTDAELGDIRAAEIRAALGTMNKSQKGFYRAGFARGVQMAADACDTITSTDRAILTTVIHVRTACKEAIRALRPEEYKP